MMLSPLPPERQVRKFRPEEDELTPEQIQASEDEEKAEADFDHDDDDIAGAEEE